MLVKINGRHFFSYGGPIKTKNKNKIPRLSLLVIIAGIFLLPQTARLSDITSEKIIELTNKQRIYYGYNILTANQLLAKAAYEKGQAILAAGEFKHNLGGRKFSDWIKDTGYKYSYVGENLAIDFVTSEGVIDAWLASESHKKNLLNQYYDEIGVAVIEGEFVGQNTVLVVQVFGAPPKAVMKPKVLGVDNGAYPVNQNSVFPYSLAYQPENLLTHSIARTIDNSLLTIKSASANLNNKLVINNIYNYSLNDLYKHFIQINFTILNTYSLIALSFLLSLIVSIVYFASFSNLYKLR